MVRLEMNGGCCCTNMFTDCDCKICASRIKIQKKYLHQIFQLYEDFHVVQVPLLGEEVRGTQALQSFSKHLLEPHPQAHKQESNSQQQEK